MTANININISDYMSEEEIKQELREGIQWYAKSKCEKFFDGCTPENGNYRSLFESICLDYMLENYKQEVDHAIDACLKYIVTQGLFKPRWDDGCQSTRRLLDHMSERLSDSHIEFKDAIIERIKSLGDDKIQDILEDCTGTALFNLMNTQK